MSLLTAVITMAVMLTAVRMMHVLAGMHMIKVVTVIMCMAMTIGMRTLRVGGFGGGRAFATAAYATHQSISSSLTRISSPAVTCSW
ncbi:hypothetical protein FBZ93_11682 [Bradyrhizobium macuxiense]|uniref:Uncharacterized protein n=1 Tax=Bradyrhizobium macuxiense TaxID=1755647 RepID=A0A560L1G3_9BRAD|nr:hypothetical protein FBZ93_11682 [Bradyrhizobium macuxiense]